MANKYGKLVKNSAIFAIANFGSKILKFLIVPFYTYYLTTSEFGTADTIITTANLFLPIIILAIHESTLRYAMKKEIASTKVFTNSFLILIIATFVFPIFYWIFLFIPLFQGLWTTFYILLIVAAGNNILLNFSRGIGKSYTFALGGIIHTISLLALNVLLLIVLKKGIDGYLWSYIGAYAISNIYLWIALKAHKLIKIRLLDSTLLKQMLSYSIPLIPSAIMWWIMNAADRYIITAFLGISATGVFSVAHKIPTIITMLYSIFQQAWQISAIEEKDSKEATHFYTKVYDSVTRGLFWITSIIFLFLSPLIKHVVSNDFEAAWEYIPFLMLSAVFSSMAGFLGVNYAASEKTKGSVKTASIGALVNLILSLILTPIIGMNGTGLATLIGFFILWIIRVQDTKKIMPIQQNYPIILTSTGLLFIDSIFMIINIQNLFFIQLIIVGILTYLNKPLFIAIKKKI